MRVLPCWLLLSATAACDSVFGLGVAEPTDLDPPAPDAAAVADCATSSTVSSTATSDSFLDSSAANGSRAVLALDANRTVIVKFAAADDVSTATLRLHHPANARGCATGSDACEACPAGTNGTVTVQWLRPDWNEHATATDRDDAGRSWNGVRASGATDVGTSTVMATYTAGMDLEVALMREPADQRAEWAFGDPEVAVRITTTTAVGVFASREAVEDTCGAVIAPTLVVGCP